VAFTVLARQSGYFHTENGPDFTSHHFLEEFLKAGLAT
jgi:hypothetical protein